MASFLQSESFGGPAGVYLSPRVVAAFQAAVVAPAAAAVGVS